MIKNIAKTLLTFVFVLLPLQVIGWIILPFILPFIPKEVEHLPKLFKIWDNHDYYYPGQSGANIDGLAGFPKYRERYGMTNDSSRWLLFWVRYKFIGFRNPVNYFQYGVIGLPIGKHAMDDYEYHYLGIPNIGWLERNGVYKLYLRHKKSGKKYYEYHRVIVIPFTEYYIELRFGHKVGDPVDRIAGTVRQYVATIRIRKVGG